MKLVTSFILSRLDYSNSVLSGRPASSEQSLRRIQNCCSPHTEKNVKLTNGDTFIVESVYLVLNSLLDWKPVEKL